MKKKLFPATLAIKAFVIINITFLISPAYSQYKIKPGLWETESKANTKGVAQGYSFDTNQMMQDAMKDALNQVPPEQRVEMEKILKSQMNNNSMKMQYCIKHNNMKDEIINSNKNCSTPIIKENGSRIYYEMKCKENNISNIMKTEVNIISPTHYKTKGTIASIDGRDKNNVDFETESKFISSNCGNIQ